MSDTKILIVEDEAIVAADLANKLGQLGYQIAGATGRGEQAVVLARELHPDLVLMDIHLAGPMDGVETAQRILLDCDVPFIYLTAHSDQATFERAKVTEPFGFILKPFDERELETSIEIALYKHQAERKIHEQREWLRVALSSIGDAVLTTDIQGRVTFLNPVAVSLTGWSVAEALEQPVQRVFNIVDDADGTPLDNFVVRVLREKRTVPLAARTALITKDGRRIPIEDSAAPIINVAGEAIGAVLIFHDITEKRRAESALQAVHADLETRVSQRTVELSETNRVLKLEIERRQQAEEAQKQVLRRLSEAEDIERGRISRELHDRLGQDLTALKLGLQWLQKQCPFVADIKLVKADAPTERKRERVAIDLNAGWDQSSAAADSGPTWFQEQCPFAQGIQDGVTKLEQMTDGLMRDIHRLAWELHPAVLDDLGLEAALRQFTTEWSERSGVTVDFHGQGVETQRLPLEIKTVLYRIAQEALTNVLRHAKAHTVSVLLERRTDRVSLIVEDDGVGFDTTALFQASGIRDKLGLLGMQERIRLAGGTLDIESTLKAGTTVFARVPLAANTATVPSEQ